MYINVTVCNIISPFLYLIIKIQNKVQTGYKNLKKIEKILKGKRIKKGL